MNTTAIPSIITRLATTADRGIRVTLETNELDGEQSSELFALKDKYGHFVFVAGDVKPEEIDVPEYVPDFKNEKSPAQRMRAVIYRLWEKSDKTVSSEQFYRERMEQIIEQIKRKLD